MKRFDLFSRLFWLIILTTSAAVQPVEAQFFDGTTINGGTVYDSQGFGTYNLSGGTLTLDGSAIFAGETTIRWQVPTSGGTLQFEPTLLTVTGGDLSLTGNPVGVRAPFTILSGGSLEINNIGVDPLTFPSPTTQEAHNADFRLVLEDQGITYVETRQPGLTLLGYIDVPYSYSVPEPSTFVFLAPILLLLGCVGSLRLSRQYKQ